MVQDAPGINLQLQYKYRKEIELNIHLFIYTYWYSYKLCSDLPLLSVMVSFFAFDCKEKQD